MNYGIQNTSATLPEKAPLLQPLDGKLEIGVIPNFESGQFPYENGELYFALIPEGRTLGEELIITYNGPRRFSGMLYVGIATSWYREQMGINARFSSGQPGPTPHMYPWHENYILVKDMLIFGDNSVEETDSSPHPITAILRWIDGYWCVVARSTLVSLTDSPGSAIPVAVAA